MPAEKQKPKRQLAKRKPDETEFEQQFEDVFQWIVAGGTEFQIKEAFAKNWPKADVMPLIAAVILKIRESSEFDSDVMRGWVFEAYREIYRRQMEGSDFAEARRTVEKIHAMTGAP